MHWEHVLGFAVGVGVGTTTFFAVCPWNTCFVPPFQQAHHQRELEHQQEKRPVTPEEYDRYRQACIVEGGPCL